MCNGPSLEEPPSPEGGTLVDMADLQKQECVRRMDTSVVEVLSYRWVERRPAQAKANPEEQRRKKDRKAALKKLASVRSFAAIDKEPCMVVPGLFVGGIGAARNIASLRKAGVRHVVNASPVVPRFYPDELNYISVLVYDDAEEDIAQYFASTNEFIEQGRREGGVLVHCYAGQSRSVALVVAYLLACEGMSFAAACAAVKGARPGARPNQGFMRQLAEYAQALGAPLDLPMDLAL